MVIAMSPLARLRAGISTVRSQPMVSSVSQNAALTRPSVVSPQNVPSGESESQEITAWTGSSSASKVSG